LVLFDLVLELEFVDDDRVDLDLVDLDLVSASEADAFPTGLGRVRRRLDDRLSESDSVSVSSSPRGSAGGGGGVGSDENADPASGSRADRLSPVVAAGS